MSLEEVVGGSLVCENLAEFLPASCLSRIQALNRATRSSLEGPGPWRGSISKNLPGFDFRLALFELPQRRRLLELVPRLLSATLAPGLPVALSGVPEAQGLVKLLSTAERNVRAHLERGGRFARSFISHVRFQEENLASALEDLGQDPHGAVELVLCPGEPIAIPAMSEGQTPDDIVLHFALSNGSLAVSARDDDVPTSEIKTPPRHPYPGDGSDDPGHLPPTWVTLDIVSSNSALTLHHKGIGISMNRPWQRVDYGMLAFTRGRARAMQALTNGVLCVFCVRDGMPHHSEFLAKTLHLEKVRR